jgi:hypothetical protein
MQVQFLVETRTVSAEHGIDESHERDAQRTMDLSSVSFFRGAFFQGVERAAPFSTATARGAVPTDVEDPSPQDSVPTDDEGPSSACPSASPRAACAAALTSFEPSPACSRSREPPRGAEPAPREAPPGAAPPRGAAVGAPGGFVAVPRPGPDAQDGLSPYERLRAANIERNRQARPKPQGAFVLVHG